MSGTDTIAYWGLDRLAPRGDISMGFWFMRQKVGPDFNNPPNFIGAHSTGDVFVAAHFGSNDEAEAYVWNNSQPIGERLMRFFFTVCTHTTDHIQTNIPASITVCREYKVLR